MSDSASRRRPFWRSWRLPCLGAFAAIFLVVSVWYAGQRERAGAQADAVHVIRRLGGWSFYDSHYAPDGSFAGSRPAGPRWVRTFLGIDFLGTVDGVTFAGGRPIEGFPGGEFFPDHGIAVTNDDLSALESLPKLEWLILTDTEITDAGLEHLEGLAELRWLWLNETAITDSGLKHLAGLRKLEKLWLDQTQITAAGVRHLAGLTNLRVLSMRNTRVDDAGLAALEKLTRLESLHLEGADCSLAAVLHLFVEVQGRDLPDALRTAGCVRWSDEDAVTSLDLSRLRVYDDDLWVLEPFSDLQWLYLNGTGITDAGLARLAHLEDLTLLHLEDTAITNAGLEHLRKLRRLETLHLEGTGVSAESAERFRESMPGALRVYTGVMKTGTGSASNRG